MGEEKDLPVGRQLVEYFMPFLLHLAESQTTNLSKKSSVSAEPDCPADC